MFRKVLTVFLVLLIPLLLHAQVREKAALKNLSAGRWSKALSILEKSLLKDSANVPAFYVLSQYYFANENPAFHLDSAYEYADIALTYWNSDVPVKVREKWSRFPVDSATILGLRREIEKSAFEHAHIQGLEESYIRFIEAFPHALERQSAIDLRNAAAFGKAQEANHYEAFLAFIDKYPDAREVPQARALYEKLLFEYFTRDQRLESFELFLRDHPNTPYRAQAEKSIFQILTSSGAPTSFLTFLERYPASRFSKTAADILYHILVEERNETLFPKAFVTDSLAQVMKSARDYVVPFLTGGRFGLMTASGKEVWPATESEIAGDYLCGNISDDVIQLSGKLIARNGAVLLSDSSIKSVDDLGYGFLFVEMAEGNLIMHKSGLKLFDQRIRNARVLLGRVLAIETAEGWGLYSFTGKKIVEPGYADISVTGDVIVFSHGRTVELRALESLTSATATNEPGLSAQYTEVRRIGENLLVKQDSLEGLIAQDGRELIPLGSHKLSPSFFGGTGKAANGLFTFNSHGERSEYFSAIEIREPWVAAKMPDGWTLYDPRERIAKSIPYDSVLLAGNFAFGKKGDSVEVHFAGNAAYTRFMPAPDHHEFLPGKDTLSFLAVVHNKKTTVYDVKGEVRFTGSFDRLQYAGNGFFAATRKDKKGLIDINGKTVLPFEFDAIGSAVDGTISLLKGMKFGLYDLGTKTLIKPAYMKNVTRFGKQYYVVYHESGYGFMDRNDRKISDATFTEIHPWSDSVALVKKEGLYHLYNIEKKRFLVEGIVRFKPVTDTEQERKYIFFLKDRTGVYSNRHGAVIPLTFSDVVNVGSAEKPLYFTEKHVREASLFVVIYYDHTGALIRREVYEQDEYDRIYCDD